MSVILEFSFREIAPQRQAVLERMGIPAGTEPPGHIGELYLAATELLADSAVPQGVLTEVTVEEFSVVFEGEGRNARRSPVGDIYPRADHLALFAATLGDATSRAITHGFEARDFAL